VLRLRFDDFSRVTRSHTMPEATARTETILETAQQLLAAAMPMIEERGITLVGVSLSGLDDGPIQLALPLDEPDTGALDRTLDDVRDRFGSDAIKRAVLVGRDTGITMPQLPD
jgi:DNA polymerase-4